MQLVMCWGAANSLPYVPRTRLTPREPFTLSESPSERVNRVDEEHTDGERVSAICTDVYVEPPAEFSDRDTFRQRYIS